MNFIKDNLEPANENIKAHALRKARVIEDGFPFEKLSEIAEIESWRKEIYRPIYHIHKWWAKRLGSIFRAAILGSAENSGRDIIDLFYKPVQLPGLTVFDPFMGSGTTIGEAYKLGCIAIGRDINPVAYRAVKTALGPMCRKDIVEKFQELYLNVGRKLRSLYKSKDSQGNSCDVLYFFWVKFLPCPECGQSVDLFPSFIFARHAYIKQNPDVHIVCPECNLIFSNKYNVERVTCKDCGFTFNPTTGWTRRTTAICKQCKFEFPIAKTSRSTGSPPLQRMFAKLVLRKDGKKEYLGITKYDKEVYLNVRKRLRSINPPLPCFEILTGYNTKQILNYGYKYWHELFNDRQLYALTLLASAIQEIPESPTRDAFCMLFSGTLEFNNMFASYKGEGTGAVRHMFSHHILKPERTPIEANVWGTPKSSGAFSTLYRSRLIKALDYRENPFEVAIDDTGNRKRGRKIFGLSKPIGTNIHNYYPKIGLNQGDIYLSCGDSSVIDLPDNSVDLVITDPPFFDNVHYSELADFFYVWQELYFNGRFSSEVHTTRRREEVQDASAESFSTKLKGVLKECHRVLKDNGLLVFSYHHSREEGWISVAASILGAGFSFIQSQPVKSEMSVAAPKSQAKEPIDIDVLFVCRKESQDNRPKISPLIALRLAEETSASKILRFNSTGRRLSQNDVRVVLLSQLLVELSPGRDDIDIINVLNAILSETRPMVNRLWASQEFQRDKGGKLQLNLWESAY